MASNLLMVAVLAMMIVPGSVLVALGLRGRWRRCEPCCARCAQLVGRYEVIDVRRCPECGSDLSGLGGVRFFSRRSRPWFLVAGAVLLLGAAVAPAAVVAMIRAVGAAAGPSTLSNARLLDEISRRSWVDGSTRPYFAEFLDRAARVPGAGTNPISIEEFRRFVDIAIDHGPDDPRAANAEIAMILEAASAAGALGPESLGALAARWFPPERMLGLPRFLREGGEVILRNRTAAGWPTALECKVWLASIDADEGTITARPIGPAKGEWMDLDHGVAARISLPAGRRTLTARLHREIHPSSATGRRAPVPPGAAPGSAAGALRSEDLTIEIPVEVLAKDAPSFIRLHSPPERADLVRQACAATALAIDDSMQSGRCVVHGLITLQYVPDQHLAFDIVAVIEGRDVPLGWIHTHATGGSSSMRSSVSAALIPCPETIPSTATVIFRPAPERVEDEPGVESIWGEPVEIPGVPVRSTRRAPVEAGR